MPKLLVNSWDLDMRSITVLSPSANHGWDWMGRGPATSWTPPNNKMWAVYANKEKGNGNRIAISSIYQLTSMRFIVLSETAGGPDDLPYIKTRMKCCWIILWWKLWQGTLQKGQSDSQQKAHRQQHLSHSSIELHGFLGAMQIENGALQRWPCTIEIVR